MYFNLLVFGLLFMAVCDMESLRSDFNSIDSEAKLNSFLSTYNTDDCHQYTPYVASVIMRQAEYESAVYKKYDYFVKGKKILEGYIAEHPSDVEARYVRALVQSNLPGILAYKGHIKSDKAFIQKNLADSDLSTEYQDIIKRNLNID